MVTRTVVGTVATVKVINIHTDVIATRNIMLPRTFEADEIDKVKRACEKAVKAVNMEETVVSVLSFVRDEKLYGVPENIFMANAVELDKETRKPLGQADAEVEAEAGEITD